MDRNTIIPTHTLIHIVYEGNDINPNGDPDNAGAPRQDEDTGIGRVSPQSVSRRIKDYVYTKHGHKPGYDLHIKRGTSIETAIKAAGEKEGLKAGKEPKGEKDAYDKRLKVSQAVCKKYFDARLLGSVLGIGGLRGESVNGVITPTWGRSVYPVTIQEDGLTRVTNTKESQTKEQDMGRKYSVAHGVYRQSFFVNPFHAKQNGATVEDLAIWLDALMHAFEYKRSGMSGQINLRGVWVFCHSSPYGDVPAYHLLDSIRCFSDKGEEARSWDDYNLEFDRSMVPDSVKVLTIEDLFGDEEAILKRLLAL